MVLSPACVEYRTQTYSVWIITAEACRFDEIAWLIFVSDLSQRLVDRGTASNDPRAAGHDL